MRIGVLVLDGVFDTGLSAVLDTFGVANTLSARPRFEVETIGVRRAVRTGNRLAVPIVRSPKRRPDLVLLPALGAKSPDALDAALATREAADAIDLVCEWRSAGARVAAACTATFLLGASGLLDAQPATTTWWLSAAFRARFPAVRLEEHRMVVEARGITTAGAALSHLDLALGIVQSLSPALARSTARHLTFDRRELQSAYVLVERIAHGDSFLERLETWTRANLKGFTVAKAARAMGVSERTLERRTREAAGRTPVRVAQDLRVDEAIFQLESTDRGVDEIADRVGYRDGVTLRTLLRRKTGLTVRQLRLRR